jgi:DNA-binding transcriptional regulator YdaS (Cro superfamily)
MSAWVGVTLALCGLLAFVALLNEAPKIIRAWSDARLAVIARSTSGNYTAEEVAAAVLVAIERTDSDVGPELAERMALTVLEDLNDGVIGPELRRPPA